MFVLHKIDSKSIEGWNKEQFFHLNFETVAFLYFVFMHISIFLRFCENAELFNMKHVGFFIKFMLWYGLFLFQMAFVLLCCEHKIII